MYGLAFPKDTRLGATESGGVDRALMRYSAKLGLAATLGYVVGVASHRSELGVIVWTTIIAGLPTYGATMRKMILRIVGGVIGGLLALPVMIVVSPNFESLGSYLLAFFVVLFVCRLRGPEQRAAGVRGPAGRRLFRRGVCRFEPERQFLCAVVAGVGHIPGAHHCDFSVLARRA